MVRSNKLLVSGLIIVLAVVSLAVVADAQSKRSSGGSAAPPPPVNGVLVLDQSTLWRLYHVLKPPLLAGEGGKLEPILYKQKWLTTDSAAPPATWMAPEFDDSTWCNRPALTSCKTPYLAAFCLRGKFTVTDPARVKGLTLTLACNGGAMVYLNGKEVARDHVTAGKGDLAYADSGAAGSGAALNNLALPVASLRQGVNVLAIEIVRAPFRNATPGKDARGETVYTLPADACRVMRLQLVAPTADGLTICTARPSGLQVWNGDVLADDFTVDYGNPGEKLQPVTIVAARNGTFSGKLVVGSPKAISGLTVTVSDLHFSGAATVAKALSAPTVTPSGGRPSGSGLPAAAIQIRYGLLWGSEHGSGGRVGGELFGAVVETPSAEFPAGVSGAVVPLWITVKTDKALAAGNYAGEIRIAAAGAPPVTVPLRVKVSDFALPDPQNFRTFIELIQSPDTLSLEYNEPLWSEKHFAMIDESFRLMSGTGDRVVHVPAIAHTNLGNAESMIRWIKTGDNQYDFDFSVMDKYLEAAKKNLGTPKILVLQVWDLYMSDAKSVGKRFGIELEQRHEAAQGGRPEVTFLNKATGKTENGTVPDLGDPASKAIWAKLLAGVRQHLRDKGLDKTALMFGMFTDAQPSKEQIQFFHDLAPDMPWVQEGHGRLTTKLYGLADIGYQASVWGCQFADGTIQQYGSNKVIPMTSLHGWKLGRLDLIFERNVDLDEYPLTRWHFYPETAITGETRGLGRIGADYWKVLKDKSGHRRGWADERFPEGAWGGSSIQLNLCSSLLAPGPSGPVATTRLLSFCEGVQECEARIVIEQALIDQGRKAQLGADLAQRCQSALDDRLDLMWKALSTLQLAGTHFDARLWRWSPGIAGDAWFASSNWPERTEKLYDLAAEVQKRVGP